MSFHGDPDNIKAAVQKALDFCNDTRLQRSMETPEEEQKRLEAKNDRISNLISAKEAKKEANRREHEERCINNHNVAIKRKKKEKKQKDRENKRKTERKKKNTCNDRLIINVCKANIRGPDQRTAAAVAGMLHIYIYSLFTNKKTHFTTEERQREKRKR